jgi:hypothetical protein
MYASSWPCNVTFDIVLTFSLVYPFSTIPINEQILPIPSTTNTLSQEIHLKKSIPSKDRDIDNSWLLSKEIHFKIDICFGPT